MSNPKIAILALVALLPGLLTGCATRPPATDAEAVAEFRATNDPIEPFNRSMFAINQALDSAVLRPAAVAYRAVLPQPVRTGLRNFLNNLRTPIILLNDMAQGQPRRAGDTLGRFVVNTTAGFGGLFDVAHSYFGVPIHYEDFGQTLATFGVGEGPYLFLPLIGPSNPRDLLGYGVDLATQPLTWTGQGLAVNLLGAGRVVGGGLDTRERTLDLIDDVNRTSLDPYATFRSGYRQSRNAAIANQDAAGTNFPR